MLFALAGQQASAEEDLFFTQVQKSTEKINLEISRARTQIEHGNTKEARQSLANASKLVDALPLGRTSGIFTGVSSGELRMYLIQIGKLLVGLDNELAESQFRKAIDVPKVFDDIRGLSDAQSSLADLQIKQGKTSDSQELKIQSIVTEKLRAAESAINAIEKEKFAKEAIEAGLRLSKPDTSLLQAYRWLGRAFEEQNRFADAQKPFKDRLALSERLNSPRDAADSVLDLGMLGESSGDYVAAEKFMRDAVAMGEKNSYAHQRLSYFLNYKNEGTLDARKFANRAMHLQMAKRYTEANSEFEKALKSAEQANSKELMISALERLQYVNRCLNKPEIAAEYEKQEAALKSKPR